MEEIKDFNVVVKVRNNKLLTAMRAAGYDSVQSLSRATGIYAIALYDYLNLKTPAMQGGEFNHKVKKLAEFLNVNPFDLFPFQFLEDSLQKNTIERDYDEAEVKCLIGTEETNPEVLAISSERDAVLTEIIGTLTPREERVIRMRFGLGGGDTYTYEEAGKVFGITRERIRQIEAKAIRKMKHPKRNEKLREYV